MYVEKDFPCFIYAEKKKVLLDKCGKEEFVYQINKEMKLIIQTWFYLFMHCSPYKR